MAEEKNPISEMPPVPPEIIEAVNENNLLVFIGAGVTRIVGGPSWDDLARGLIDSCHGEDGTGISHFECEQLKKNNPKKIITIAKRILGDKYKEKVKELLKVDAEKMKKYPIYEYIYKLRATYLTTNIDDVFDSYFMAPINLKLNPNGLRAGEIKPPMLCHIHGSVNSEDEMVLTANEYLKHYSANKEWITEFLSPIFQRSVVLFIGYGMEEIEVLENLFRKTTPPNSYKKKRFLLLPFFTANQKLFEFEKGFYKELEIEAIAYSIDSIGYAQLSDVLKFWQEQINNISSFQLQLRAEIDEVL